MVMAEAPLVNMSAADEEMVAPPKSVAIPDTARVVLSVVAPLTPSVPPSSVAPVPDTVRAPMVVAPDAPSVPATETPVEASASKLG